ncbi:MAG: Flp pilus assembly complex ATPase component TadA [Deltaproteobacteria bacterium]|nr:Flp pilus assembly complex ATPase component TadA [Deltaproteobacteria bacterium]
MAKRIGDLLKDEGIIGEEEIGFALKEQLSTEERIGEILIRMGLTTDSEVAMAIARQSQKEYLNLKEVVPQKEALKALPFTFARDNQILPVRIENNNLVVATSEPDNIKVLDLASRISKKTVECDVASSLLIQKHIEKEYYLLEHPLEEDIKSSLNQAKQNIRSVDIERLTQLLFISAINLRATDIHITPTQKTTHIRYRIDGVIYTFYTFPIALHSRLISNIKIKAGMDISEQRRPQDGRMTFEFLNEGYDMRISTLRTSNGENLVIRILSTSEELYSLRNLGLEEDGIKALKEVFNKPFGMVFVAGPTGSGKTTTLYAALRAINALEKNVLTVEDPIEYHFPLIRQTQVNEKADYVFASAVRSFLRQDPDVILIGEVRDPETANMAIRAATTGHLVLSTIHANNAVGAIPRLKDLGIGDIMLSSSLLCVIAQRLVRKLCPHCKKEYTSGEIEKETFGISPGTKLYDSSGCPDCLHTGFLGRTLVSEIFLVSEEIERMLSEGAHPFEIKKVAINKGMNTLWGDGKLKILSGITSVKEAIRVLS